MNLLLDILSLGCRLFIGGLLVYASHDKVIDPVSFAQSVGRYDILPLFLVNGASVLMAWLELVTGLFLLAGLWIRPAALWSTALFALFTGLMVWAGITGAGYDCGCFPGQVGHTAGWGAAFRDLFFLLPSAFVLWRPARLLALDGLGKRA